MTLYNFRCGISLCLKKCLNLLPSVGDDDEGSDADYEVCDTKHIVGCLDIVYSMQVCLW